MDMLATATLALIFLSVFCISLVVMRWVSPNAARERLQQIGARQSGTAGAASNTGLPAAPAGNWMAQLVKLSGPLAKLSLPREGWEKTPLRMRFVHAGFRGEHAAAIYFGAKTTLVLGLPALLWLTLLLTKMPDDPSMSLLLILAASGFGLYLPNLVLARCIRARKQELIDHFPDALDLMTVCVEAGLALDAALARVAEEMATTAKLLSEELYLVTLELRAGSSRETALRNLALRTGLEEVESLVGMLLQADRFGTSVGSALRVQAEGMRTKRRQRAEEAAAKVALKLLFPLIFCIFPALIMVLLGPAIIMAYRLFKPAVGV